MDRFDVSVRQIVTCYLFQLIPQAELSIMHGFPNNAPVAQLDRVLGYELRGREFESLRARHIWRLDISRKLNIAKRYLII